MTFGGLQKLTLLDFPGHVACTIFTSGCNFRCPFCHNASLVTHTADADEIPEEEILAFLKKRSGILEGVAVTGGEPLLWTELPEFLRKVRALGYRIKLDTNGSFPERLKAVLDEGLADYIAMDIKNCPEKYALTAGSDRALVLAEQSKQILLGSGMDFEFRTTVVKGLHTPEDIGRAAQWISGAKKYFLQPFVDSGDVISGGLSAPDTEELEQMLSEAQKVIPETKIRGR